MRVAISGTHGIGKTTLVEALCARLPGHVTVDEPYYLLEEQGYEFDFPPSSADYRAMLACSVRSLRSPSPSRAVFDRTPLDYLAYLAANGADPSEEVDASTLRLAFATLDLLIIAVATPESERILPAAELPGLRARMNDALLELVYDDPLDAWNDTPVLELSGPLDSRLDAILDVLRPASAGPDAGTTGAGAGRPWPV
ncbi:AAA family ATPase [Micromonospora matsumotoense]|uniref:AAA family ATPase n=1 Tax=Micromonospora matsumotoense TaxID=121616 RepID=UPI0033D095CB